MCIGLGRTKEPTMSTVVEVQDPGVGSCENQRSYTVCVVGFTLLLKFLVQVLTCTKFKSIRMEVGVGLFISV